MLSPLIIARGCVINILLTHCRPSFAETEQNSFLTAYSPPNGTLRAPINFATLISYHYLSLAVQHTTTNRSVYFDYFLKGLWWVVIGMGTDNLSELCCSVFLSCCTYCFLCFECRFNVGSCFWVGTVRLNTYIYLIECAGRVSWGYFELNSALYLPTQYFLF